MQCINDNYKNIDVITRQLSNLKYITQSFTTFYFEYLCKQFCVIIESSIEDLIDLNSKGECVTNYKCCRIFLEEWSSSAYSDDNGNPVAGWIRINLSKDPRFKDYEPIKYNGWNGERMPILKLCELIKYLYRLNNLRAFS